MLPAERRRAIVAAVVASPSMKTDDLAAEFNVSAETIRRDLLRLQQDGLVERVHGGATPTDQRPRAIEASYVRRQALNIQGKRRMAEAAAKLVQPGDTIIIDVGTSTLEVARMLPLTWTGRLLTNSLSAACEVADRPGVEVLVSGGRLRAGDLVCAGGNAEAFFRDYYADIAFLGSGGLDARAGLTDYHSDEVDVRRVMIEHSTANYALVDSTKLGTIAARHVCPLDQLTGVVTDSLPTGVLAEALNAANVRVVGPHAEPADSG